MHHRTTAIAAVFAALVLGACSSTTGRETLTHTTGRATSTTIPTAAGSLTIVVTNDDGIGAPGIDALVTAVSAIDHVQVVVVAPAENMSGSSDKATPGGASHHDGQTASGVHGTAVDGFPADAVTVALDDLGVVPDLVVSGVNQGQNLGPIAYISGTVGAARTAARRGIPAVAASAGVGTGADYKAAAALVVAWIADHRAALVDGTVSTTTVTSFNVPDCSLGGVIEALLQVPLATAIPKGVDPSKSDCRLEPNTPPADDVAAVVAGHAAETPVPLDAP